MKQKTIAVYDRTAGQMAKKFRRIGPRVQDIELAFRLAGNPKEARVVEIGCGDGRDALEITERAQWYLGFDPSKEFIKIAKNYAPKGNFQTADAITFEYPEQLDIVFAFASLLHLDKTEVELVLRRVHEALKHGGIFFISLKWAPEYTKKVKKDEFGERLFYFYTPELITQLAGSDYSVELIDRQAKEGLNHPDWFTIALKKI